MTLGQNSPGKDLKVRYLYLGGAFLLGLMVLAGRLYRLQITRGDEFATKSVENFVKEVRIPADRGMILDERGRILVDGRPSFDVMITPAFCAKCKEDVLPKLARWLSLDAPQTDDVWKLIQRAKKDAPFRPVPVRIDVPRELADVLDAHLTELPGVEVQATPHRNYRTGPVMSHVLGYMNEITPEEYERLNARGGSKYELGDYIGRRGIEKAFETFLRGKDGERKQVVDAKGKPIPGLSDLVGSDKVVAPVAGNNVVLSIDMRLQEEADRAFPGQAGGVVVVDVKTGFVKALLSRPGYDPNLLTGRITATQMAELAKDPYKPLMNRVTQMHYSPGSTFKVVTALAALREHAYTATQQVNCPGGYRLGSRVWRCDKETGHGLLDVAKAIQMSCDVFFYKAGDIMGIDPIAREARELGLGQTTGITGLLEEPGIIPDSAYHDRVTPGGYTKGMALNTAIGQGDVNVTPIQLVMMYSALANGGKLFRPQLVRRIESPDGQVVKSFDPELVRTVDMKPEHRAVVLEGLRMVVNEPGGTAYGRRLKDIIVAGKTGTAQVVRLGDKRVKAEDLDYWVRDHAWFAAFAPANDPEVAVVVLNEHAGFGASGAAPVAMQVIQKYFDLKKEDAARSVPVAGLEGSLPTPSGLVPATSAVPANVLPAALGVLPASAKTAPAATAAKTAKASTGAEPLPAAPMPNDSRPANASATGRAPAALSHDAPTGEPVGDVLLVTPADSAAEKAAILPAAVAPNETRERDDAAPGAQPSAPASGGAAHDAATGAQHATSPTDGAAHDAATGAQHATPPTGGAAHDGATGAQHATPPTGGAAHDAATGAQHALPVTGGVAHDAATGAQPATGGAAHDVATGAEHAAPVTANTTSTTGAAVTAPAAKKPVRTTPPDPAGGEAPPAAGKSAATPSGSPAAQNSEGAN